MTISVLVPTYRRAQDFQRCLEGLRKQSRPADEVLVVARPDDQETQAVLSNWLSWEPLKVIEIHVPGQVAALNAGLDAAHGEIIAITDDDAIPHPDWLQRIEQHFTSDPKLGGLGGRDWVYVEVGLLDRPVTTIGKVEWFGKVIGNHHFSNSYRGPVDILKGANMSYRAAAIANLRFDTSLRGKGAQVCNDMEFSLNVKRHGWTLLYDVDVAIDHFPATRVGEPHRLHKNLDTVSTSAFNLYRALAIGLPPGTRRTFALLWQRLVASPPQPGLLRALYGRLRGQKEALTLWRHANRARSEAIASLSDK